jgi:molybdopterin converting factor subunit 1
MTVHVRLFARARELAGADAVAIELPEVATVADLRIRLGEAYPTMSALLSRSAVAVNEEFAADHVAVFPGAEVAVLPPVSGG